MSSKSKKVIYVNSEIIEDFNPECIQCLKKLSKWFEVYAIVGSKDKNIDINYHRAFISAFLDIPIIAIDDVSLLKGSYLIDNKVSRFDNIIFIGSSEKSSTNIIENIVVTYAKSWSHISDTLLNPETLSDQNLSYFS